MTNTVKLRRVAAHYGARRPRVNESWHYRVSTAKGVEYFSTKKNAITVLNHSNTGGKLEQIRGDYWATIQA